MHCVLNSTQHVARLLASCLPSGVPFQRSIGVALSGGPDSTALAYLLHRHVLGIQLQLDSKIERVNALIIDHGLRAGSAKEAEQVMQWTRALGIPCEVQAVPWGEPPFPSFPTDTSIEAAARTARIILYKRFLRKHGLHHLYLAHHLDDQVETAYLRQRRGTASALALPGLRSYTHLPLVPDPFGPDDEKLALVRPPLSITKAELIGYCKHHKLNYVTDPTNADPTYTARNAFRSELKTFQARTSLGQCDQGPVKALRKWTNRLVKRRDLVEAKVQSLLQTVQHDTPVPSTCTFNPIDFRNERPEVRHLLLSRIARMVSPSTNTSSISPSSMVELDNEVFRYRCKDTVHRMKITPGAGVMFTAKQKKGKQFWIVSRQPLRAAEQAALTYTLPADRWSLWDGRFWLRAKSSTPGPSSETQQAEVSPSPKWVLPIIQPPESVTIVQVGCTRK